MFTTRPELHGTFAMVSSTHWLASASAMAALERGGNAFDAAVAGGLTLQVCEPHLNGPGGDLPIIMHDAASGATKVLCGQGTAPAGATITHYRSEGLEEVPGTGLLATVVPGAFDTWMTLLRDYGTLGLDEVFEHALGYAENGVPVIAKWTETTAGVAEMFATEWPSSQAVFMPDGRIPQPGELFANKTLAATWKRLLAEASVGGGGREACIDRARKVWAQGFIAEEIDSFCRDNAVMDTSGARHRGVLTGEDMARWQASYDDPVSLSFGDYTVSKCGFWSQGPAMLQTLALLQGFDLDALDPSGPEFVHLVTECAKLAFADRDAFYGDPDFVDIPGDILLSAEYSDRRRKLVGEDASLEYRPGEIAGYGSAIDYEAHVEAGRDPVEAAGIGEPTVRRSGQFPGDTCHIDVIDRDGNMVTCMPSGGWLQSSPVIPALGFALNTRGQMFWLDDSHPAALGPGRRPRTTLSPSLAHRGGQPYMVFGTPGGDQQDQWQTNFFLFHAVAGRNLQEAIDAPNFHNEHFPKSFFPRPAFPGLLMLEGRMPEETVANLARRGHNTVVGEDWSEGRMCAVAREGGMIKAAANPRGMQGYAAGR